MGKREMVGKSVRNVVVVGVLLVVLGREVAAAERTQTLVSPPSRTRMVDVGTPTSYDAGREEGCPLLMILHGLGLVGEIAAGRFQADEISDDLDLIWTAPDAFFTSTSSLSGFAPVPSWCATEQCCCGVRCSSLVPFGRDNICDDSYDRDSRFLRDTIETIVERFNVDPSRIYVTGVSNGGWMTFRLACDHSDIIAGIMPVCGAPYRGNLRQRCPNASPIHLLHVHGELDFLVDYAGNTREQLDSAEVNVRRWAREINNCEEERAFSSPYVTNNPHSGYGSRLEERVDPVRYTNCDAATELWTVRGVGHCPYTSYYNLRWLLDKWKVGMPSV